MYVVLYRVYLIGSTPGRYQGPAMEKWGHLRLRKVMFFCLCVCDCTFVCLIVFPSIVPLCPRHKNDVHEKALYAYWMPLKCTFNYLLREFR